jgi:hypothetical protein
LFADIPTNRLAEMPAPTFKEKAYNALSDFGKAGEQDIANIVTGIPKMGYALGQGIARIADQERSVVVPGNDLRVAKEAMIDTGKQLAQGVAYPYLHPIQSFKEQPITTTLAWSPLALAAEKKLGLTPATRPVKVAAKAAKLETKATNKYREMLKPTAGDIKAVEVKRGLSIDDSYNLAAKEKLPIESTKTGKDMRLDTAKAREMVKKKASAANKELTAKLNEHRQTFDIRELGKQALDDIEATVKDATEAKTMKRDVNRFLQDNIERNNNSPVFTTAQLNKVKGGLWNQGYNQLKPTAKVSARKFGHIIADTIEQSITDVPVKELNNLTSKYLTLNDLLENAHGRVVQGGKLSQYFGKTIGTGIGGAAGYAVGGPAGSVIGAGAGAYAGGEAVAAFNSPSRMSRIGATAMEQSNKLKLMNSPTDRMIRGIDRLPQRIPQAPNINNQRGGIGKSGSTLTGQPMKEAINKANQDIQRAKQLMVDAPETSPFDSGIKIKSDYQNYIKDTQSWLDSKLPTPQTGAIGKVGDELKPLMEKPKKLDYGMQHRPTEGPPANDLLAKVDGGDFAPNDIYEHPQWYANGDGSLADRQSISAIHRLRGNKDAMVTIYRASPKNELHSGDWVSLSHDYAKGEALSEGVKVNSFKVKASDVKWAGDSLNEFGYFPKSGKSILESPQQVVARLEKDLAYVQKRGKIPPNADIKGFNNSPEYGKYGTTERQQASAYYEYIDNKIKSTSPKLGNK